MSKIVYQGWVEKKAKRTLVSKTKWRKRWLVLYASGFLEAFEDRAAVNDKDPLATYEVGPESTISKEDKDNFRLTWGEKETFQARVFRCPNRDSDKWLRKLSELALRKRLTYVLSQRDAKIEKGGGGKKGKGRAAIGPSGLPSPRRNHKDLSSAQGKLLSDKFHGDQKQLWKEAVRFEGEKLYFSFNKQDVEILWKMYVKGKPYCSKEDLKSILFDAFVAAFNEKSAVKVRKTPNANSFLLTISERTYNAKLYLDQDMDGQVTFEEFSKINTKEFWFSFDFLSSIDPESETRKLWISIFECLEETGGLSKKVIYRVWEKYNSKEDGFLYQQNMEDFLADFIRATPFYWPETDQETVVDFLKQIVLRGAIALRYLDTDQDGRISRQEFSAIGYEDFWVHVDYLTSLDQDADELKLDHNDSVVDLVDSHYSSFKEYSLRSTSDVIDHALLSDANSSARPVAAPRSTSIGAFMARPSFKFGENSLSHTRGYDRDSLVSIPFTPSLVTTQENNAETFAIAKRSQPPNKGYARKGQKTVDSLDLSGNGEFDAEILERHPINSLPASPLSTVETLPATPNPNPNLTPMPDENTYAEEFDMGRYKPNAKARMQNSLNTVPIRVDASPSKSIVLGKAPSQRAVASPHEDDYRTSTPSIQEFGQAVDYMEPSPRTVDDRRKTSSVKRSSHTISKKNLGPPHVTDEMTVSEISELV